MTAPPSATHRAADVGPTRWHWQQHPAGTPAEPVARAWLAGQVGVAREALVLGRDSRGRPRLGASHAGVDCNWSHSGGGLLLAVGRGVRVGVDLEYVRPRPRALALAGRYFTASETRWLAAFDPACGEPARGEPAGVAQARVEHAFLRLWCAKEAVLKAHGHGLSFGLDRLCFEARDGALQLAACDPTLGAPSSWWLHEFAPAQGYVAALAWRAG